LYLRLCELGRDVLSGALGALCCKGALGAFCVKSGKGDEDGLGGVLGDAKGGVLGVCGYAKGGVLGVLGGVLGLCMVLVLVLCLFFVGFIDNILIYKRILC
jgi:hypothetical protein